MPRPIAAISVSPGVRRQDPGHASEKSGRCDPDNRWSSHSRTRDCGAAPLGRHRTHAAGRRRVQAKRKLGADEVVGPRERPKEGTASVVKRPASAAGSHPQLRLFGVGLPPRAQPHVTRLVAQLKVGCPTPSELPPVLQTGWLRCLPGHRRSRALGPEWMSSSPNAGGSEQTALKSACARIARSAIRPQVRTASRELSSGR
jgi:hypothetical protein